MDTAVEEVPCSTGWCSKVLEGLDKNFGDNDYGIATERQCMERAPSDNQERCDFVQLGLKKVSSVCYYDYVVIIIIVRSTCASARVTCVTEEAWERRGRGYSWG